jgi:hypothetical protein
MIFTRILHCYPAYYLASRGLVFAFCLLAMSTLTPTDAAEKDPLLHCHPLGTFSGRPSQGDRMTSVAVVAGRKA